MHSYEESTGTEITVSNEYTEITGTDGLALRTESPFWIPDKTKTMFFYKK